MTTPGDRDPYSTGDRDPYTPGAPGTPPPVPDGAFPLPPEAPPQGHPAHGHPHDGPAAGGYGIEGRIVEEHGPGGYGAPAGYGTPTEYGTTAAYGTPGDFGSGYGSEPAGYGTDPAGHGTGPGYAAGPGYASGHGFRGGGDGGTYVPEPLGGQLPAEADPGAAYGVPTAGDAWGGHAPAQESHQGPAGVDGWGQPPQAAQPWEHSAAADAHAGYAPGQPAQQWSQPHAPAGQQGYAAAYDPAYDPGHRGAEHTAVLPLVEEAAPQPQAAPAAPVRTGSPIIPPGIQPAALTAALGLLMAGGAALAKPGLALVLVVLEAVTAAGWFRLNGMWPARQGIMLAFLSGVTADIALLAADGSHNAEVLMGTLGVWLLLVLVLQLRHHGSADERLSSLTATAASTLLTVVAAAWLATAASGAGSDPVVVGAIAVAAATLVRAVRLPGGEPVSLVLSVLVALATGLATGPATGMGTGHGVLLAAASGACALVGLRVASYDFPSRFVHFTAGVALPLTAAAPVVYVLGNALH